MNPTLPPALQPLAALLERAVAERDEATARLYLLLENGRRLQSQQHQLHAYRSEYQARWCGQFRQSAPVQVVHSYQAFVTRLDHALQQLQAQLDDANAQAEGARELLLQCEMRVAAVRKLLERRLSDHGRGVLLREQKQTDEFASAALWRGGALLAAPMNS